MTDEDIRPPSGEDAKALGAFYTDTQIADFLVWWAIRSPHDTVMDPSFGGAVFLRSACKRLLQLGGDPADQVRGVEIDPDVHAKIADKLAAEFGVQRRHLLRRDFFEVDPTSERQVDVIVGNPPFIRYQRFTGTARERALRRSADEGVRLNRLSSSWAPFLVHSIAMLKPGGRLAMVIPVEIGHAAYALPVLQHLRRSFGQVTFLTFRKKLFPDLSEDTLLLLAENKGGSPGEFLLRDLTHSGYLAEIQRSALLPVAETEPMQSEALAEGRERLIEYLIPKKARELYQELKRSRVTRRLGDLADVGIGYVTGANEFFHLSPEEVRTWGIPDRYLRPAVRRGRALTGLRFTVEDWTSAVATGEAGYLLYIKSSDNIPDSVRRYVQRGEEQGVPKAYKCRVRSPWYSVPHVYLPDAFLSYMSGAMPYLVANDADVVAPNSLHILRLHPGVSLTSDAIAALWQTALTRLSVEIEGHPLGGGMLKLEPTEAENVLLAVPQSNGALIELAEELDTLIRNGDSEAAQERADDLILRQWTGLSKDDCRLLRTAANSLRHRRYARGGAA